VRLSPRAQNALPIVIGYLGGSPDPSWSLYVWADANEWRVTARPGVWFESRARSDRGCGDRSERQGGGRTPPWRRVAS
jgi:hypothetical protein